MFVAISVWTLLYSISSLGISKQQRVRVRLRVYKAAILYVLSIHLLPSFFMCLFLEILVVLLGLENFSARFICTEVFIPNLKVSYNFEGVFLGQNWLSNPFKNAKFFRKWGQFGQKVISCPQCIMIPVVGKGEKRKRDNKGAFTLKKKKSQMFMKQNALIGVVGSEQKVALAVYSYVILLIYLWEWAFRKRSSFLSALSK